MKKYLISALAALALLMMMCAGGTAEEHFQAGFILACVSLAMFIGVVILCHVWKEDLKKAVDDED